MSRWIVLPLIFWIAFAARVSMDAFGWGSPDALERTQLSKPLDELPLDVLARRAGVSKGLAYHYFPSKDALVTAVIHRRIDEVAEIARSVPVDLPPRERLAALAHAFAADVARDPAGFRLYLRVLARPDTQDAVAPAATASDPGSLVPLFEALGTSNPAEDARFFQVSLLGILTHLAISPVPSPPEPLVDALIRTLPEAP